MAKACCVWTPRVRALLVLPACLTRPRHRVLVETRQACIQSTFFSILHPINISTWTFKQYFMKRNTFFVHWCFTYIKHPRKFPNSGFCWTAMDSNKWRRCQGYTFHQFCNFNEENIVQVLCVWDWREERAEAKSEWEASRSPGPLTDHSSWREWCRWSRKSTSNHPTLSLIGLAVQVP